MVLSLQKRRHFFSALFHRGEPETDLVDRRHRFPEAEQGSYHHRENEDQLANVRRLVRAGTLERGQIYAVSSGRGGVGKSNIVLNLAMALARMGRAVTLFDGAQQSDILFLLGRRPTVEPGELLRDANGLSGTVFEEDAGLRVISIGSSTEAWDGFEMNVKDRILREIIKQSSEREFVFIDTAAGNSDRSVELLLKADNVIVVITPEPTAVSDGYALIKLLSRLDPDIQFSILVNRVATEGEAIEVYERFSLVIDHFLDTSTDLFGYVLEDRRLTKAVQSQKPVLAAYPRCKISKCIRQLAERMNT